jgi:hypothetical protein
VKFVLEAKADFTMRIASKAGRFPLRIFVMCLSPPDECCEERRQVAKELLTWASSADVDQFSKKFVQLFRSEIEALSNNMVATHVPSAIRSKPSAPFEFVLQFYKYRIVIESKQGHEWARLWK